ncbi:hypothetical protein ABH931_006421 [Streptacidiphilus sp. MAP12-33]|uniref:hypothetical protein n=1 Tax=Streptacidiphilus sp. MAP12-33 TaxID=3156266 RepID=UPI0035142A7B
MASTFALHSGAALQGRAAHGRVVQGRSGHRRPLRAMLPALPTALVGMGLALLPWMCLLAAQGEWSWVGLDVLEAAGLIATGLLLRRGDARAALTAAATTALLLTDAWFDVTTSHGAELVQAWVLALLLELPIAALCGRLALRTR